MPRAASQGFVLCPDTPPHLISPPGNHRGLGGSPVLSPRRSQGPKVCGRSHCGPIPSSPNSTPCAPRHPRAPQQGVKLRSPAAQTAPGWAEGPAQCSGSTAACCQVGEKRCTVRHSAPGAARGPSLCCWASLRSLPLNPGPGLPSRTKCHKWHRLFRGLQELGPRTLGLLPSLGSGSDWDCGPGCLPPSCDSGQHT